MDAELLNESDAAEIVKRFQAERSKDLPKDFKPGKTFRIVWERSHPETKFPPLWPFVNPPNFG